MKRLVVVLMGVWLAAGCTSNKSFALVSVLSSGGSFDDVSQLLVGVTNGGYRDALTYPKSPSGPYHFDESKALTFSIGFDPLSHGGELDVSVTTLDPAAIVTGYGVGAATIDSAHVTQVMVKVTRGAQPPGSPGDGGAPLDGASPNGGGLACDPQSPTTTCSPGKTCVVGCHQDDTTAAMCIPAGSKQPGEVCNDDCIVGSECFTFGCDNGTSVRTCLQLCQGDGDCQQGRCATSIPCGQQATPYKSCSRPCDPVANSGCAQGLSCFVFPGEIPDCDCPSVKRTGGNGAACASTDTCQAGLFCVSGGGSQTCRPLCLLAAPQCAAGTTCTKLVDPDFATYGACLPM